MLLGFAPLFGEVASVNGQSVLNHGSTVIKSGNGNGALEPGECNDLFFELMNPGGNTVSNVTATLSSATPGLLVTQPYSTYPNIPASGAGTNLAAFQLSVLPSLACGDTAQVFLVVSAADAGTFSIPISFRLGVVGPPARFDNNQALTIPDSGSVTSSINVSNVTGLIAKVTVSILVTHPYDEDLSIVLVAPDNSFVTLTAENGGVGDNYGTNCALDAARTTFDDAAPASITNGVAPFVGTFRPQDPAALALFNGKTGANVNGRWSLLITDGAAGDIGLLHCWSLFISSLNCAAGGGECKGCPGAFSGAITGAEPKQTGRLNITGTNSTCAALAPCPAAADALPRAYTAHTFTNATTNALCVTAALNSSCGGAAALFAAAYQSSFDPMNICSNYLADIGDLAAPFGWFSFTVPAETAFVVVVHAFSADANCPAYELKVTGLLCPQPALNVTRLPAANGVKLFWSTAHGGYDLEATPALSPAGFVPLTNMPVVVNGDYTVTNATSGSDRFYRLRKP
jgi:Proprotein convertase P-domain